MSGMQSVMSDGGLHARHALMRSVYGLHVYPYGAGIDFSRQNLTSVDSDD